MALAPKVSVLMCSYNRPDLLRAAVRSLRDQTDPDWELLICDDASTDPRVLEVLQEETRDPRVRAWRRETNIDQPSALWNFLFDRSMGRYVTVLDDDNEKLPRFVEVLAGFLDQRPSLDFVTCGFVVVEGDRRTDYYLNLSTASATLDDQSTCDGGAVLFRRETFERTGYFSESLRTGEDWDWLRRSARWARFENLHECHSTYRVHRDQRMTRSAGLGLFEDVERVRGRVLLDSIGVRVVRPPPSRLTRSQEDAISGVDRAIRAIPHFRVGTDLALVLSPFQLSDEDIRGGVGGCSRVLSVHIEDPYAIQANVERVRAMVALGVEVWVSTNDVSAVPRYREIVGDRVIVCPLLGVDSTLTAPIGLPQRDVDVLLCGYAYPSRRRFVAELVPLLARRHVLLVGDGWEGQGGVETMSTRGIEETYRIFARSRAIVCLHRTRGDCTDGPFEPRTVNRGYMEGYFGGRVFVDESRAVHSFDPGDVVWYGGPSDLARSLHGYLDGSPDPMAASFARKCQKLYTYRARVSRMVQCVFSPRFLAMVP